MKKILLFMTVLFVGFGLSACEEGDRDPDPTDQNTELIELTIEELAEYDGQNGNKAYIAVDGVIYDVTDDPNWQSGSHNGYTAGLDLTEEIGSVSPHGTSVLDGVPIVGELIESTGNNVETMYITIEELMMYDGTNDNPSYIAVNGIIYDVSNHSEWTSGSHNGMSPGNDLTQEISLSPHGESVLNGLPVIGELVVDHSGDRPYDPYLYLTVTELAMYDGSNSNDAYIAVEGVIYDVTGIPAWTGGSHNGNMAGQDLTDEIMNAPHGESVLDGLIIVGELIT